MSLIIASVHGEVPNAVDGADMIELRIDSMQVDHAIQQLPAMLESAPLPIVLTCRSVNEGGSFDGDEEGRVAMYTAALQCATPPRYIDIEHETLLHHPNLLDTLPLGEAGVILSWHDCIGRPQDLLQRAAAMQLLSGAGIDVVKMVWRARSLRDNLEAFELLRSRQQPMIAMCLGEYSLMSRVLAPKFGGFATYASVDGHEPTAAGQPTVQALLKTFRFRSINEETVVYGVIGEHVAQSAGLVFHNAAFETQGKNAVYLPLPIPKGWEHLKATVLEMIDHQALDFSGASITIPHKEHMLQLVQETKGIVDDSCANSGATNTVSMEDGIMSASNTDVQALATLAPNAKTVLILGAGGVARAAVSAMASLGATVYVAARNNEQAATLASELPCEVAANDLEHIDTVINCTPVGMRSGNDPDGDPALLLAPNIEIAPSMTVIDTVYDPIQTPLVQRATKIGCNIVTGEEMFRVQAVAQQQIWSAS